MLKFSDYNAVSVTNRNAVNEAYMSKEKKADIAAQLKKIVPKGWKYSLAVHNASTIIFTLISAPASYFGEYDGEYMNPAYPEKVVSKKALPIVTKIMDALNSGNYDNSDIQTDYFDVGHYVSFNIGRWNKPFVATNG